MDQLKANFNLLLLATLALILSTSAGLILPRSAPPLPPAQLEALAGSPAPNPTKKSLASNQADGQNLPALVKLTVPFSAQAPFGNWDEPYKNACEETSLIMAVAWLKGQRQVEPAQVDQQIRQLIDIEKNLFGYYKDISSWDTSLLLAKAYGLTNYQVVRNVGVQKIKQALAKDKLVIAPVVGGILNNPNYSSDTRFYHMLVVTGYNDQEKVFYTNDPGTSRGENYPYPYSIFEQALTDWDQAKEQPVKNGNAVIIISRN